MKFFQWIFSLIFGTKQDKDMKKARPLVKKINALEESISALNNDELIHKTEEFRERWKNGESLDDILPEAYAVAREASKRVLGMRPFDVQLIGGIALHHNTIAEMKTGEGKTLVATLPFYLNGLTGKGCHLVTVNDYLAKRDAIWMGPLYKFLDLSIGIINHEKSYRLEWDDISSYTVKPIECSRQEAYNCDITYGTNNEFGFDYLRDNMAFSKEQKTQRSHYFAVVDEVDSILIDEARTPLIISGPSESSTEQYYQIDKYIPRLTQAELNDKREPVEGTGDYAVDEKDKTAVLTEQGVQKLEKLMGINDLYSPQHSRKIHYITQAIRAHALYHRDVDYVIENGEVVIVDEFTGRKMPGRRWSDGLHQAIESKERVQIKQEFQTLATITFQNFFKMYDKLAGMTGTAETEAVEFYSIYKLDVMAIPTNKPIARADHPDKIYINEKAKYNAIARDVEERHRKGQPMLIGTISVEKSEHLSNLLKRRNIRHSVLNAKYHEKEAEIVARAGKKGSVTIATNMAGRGTDIKIDDEVRALGGLCVIGTERHEARRIDNQLRGRSGRQGDAGVSQFYVSLEDDLMRLFGMNNQIGLMSKMGFGEEDEIQAKMISNAIEKAQKRVETRNFEIRKNLLEYDNVMNEQRTYIYSLRDRILDISNNIDVIDELIEDIISVYIEDFPHPSNPEKWDTEEIEKWFKFNFYADESFDFSEQTLEEAKKSLHNAIKKTVWARFDQVPAEIKAEGFKYVVLQSLDTRWKEHLKNIDAIQDSIGLRGYAQKNPIVEYKFEAFREFEQMKASFKLESLSLLSRLEIKTEFQPVMNEFESTSTQIVHNEYGQFDSINDPQGQKPSSAPQPLRRPKKLGRNDPCWCGSGKKYKNCHMDEDMAKMRANRP